MARRKLFRVIIPAYPKLNIYTQIVRRTTALGPILIASAANKLPGWEVEVIDENDCDKRTWPPDTNDGYIDHRLLQEQRPADVVGFYASMSSSIPRVIELAKFYQGLGAITIAGGYHAKALPRELILNGLDAVVLDIAGAEKTVVRLLEEYDHCQRDFPIKKVAENRNIFADYLCEIPGLAWLDPSAYKGLNHPEKVMINPVALPQSAEEAGCQVQPLPDFGLLRYAKVKLFPITWRRGCPYKCKFCAVKESPEKIQAEEFLARVEYYVEKFGAKSFFIVDDHFGGSLNNPADYDETMRLLAMLHAYQLKIGKRLSFTVQIRLNMSEKTELISAMKRAGIDHVCIGFESPIDDELLDMNKGYTSAEMIRWTNLWHKAGMFVHGMFIFFYPKSLEQLAKIKARGESQLTVSQCAGIVRRFIKQAKINTAQILLTVPLPDTELRAELEAEKRLFPLELIGWEYYDGQFPLYDPIVCTPEELQEACKSIMRNFYGFRNFFRVLSSIIFLYPIIVFPSIATLLAFRVDRIKAAHKFWQKRYWRDASIRFGGWFIVKSWLKKFRHSDFPEQLKKARAKLAERDKSNK